MPYNAFGAFRPSGKRRGVDRGTARGAKRVIVTKDFQLLDHALAKQHGLEGDFFQSMSEAKRWIYLNIYGVRSGNVRNLRRQVKFDLHVVRPDGLKQKIGWWVADHVYEEKRAIGPQDSQMWIGEASDQPTAGRLPYEWVQVVEDVKPSGGHREDVYLWKRKHVEAEYGITVTEFAPRGR